MKRNLTPSTTDATIIDWKEFEDLPEVLPTWLIRNLLPTGSLICLYGKRGEGKTFLALDWACCVATGTDWQGKRVKRGRVAYLLAERPSGLGRRLRGWMNHVGMNEATGGERLKADGIRWLVFGRQRFPLDVPDDRKRLIELLRKEFPPPQDGEVEGNQGLSLLVMDPLVFFMSGSENDTNEMQGFIDGALDLVNELGCSLLLVHHEGKGNVNNTLGARGSSALEAGMDTVIYLSPKGINDVAEMAMTKQREARAMKKIFLHFKEQEHRGRRRGIFPTITDEKPVHPDPPSKLERKAKAEAKKMARGDDNTRQMMVMEAAKELTKASEKLTIRSLHMKINEMKIGKKSKTSTIISDSALRNIVEDMCISSKLILEEKNKGSRADVFSLPPPEKADAATATTEPPVATPGASEPPREVTSATPEGSSATPPPDGEASGSQGLSGSENNHPADGDQQPTSVDDPKEKRKAEAAETARVIDEKRQKLVLAAARRLSTNAQTITMDLLKSTIPTILAEKTDEDYGEGFSASTLDKVVKKLCASSKLSCTINGGKKKGYTYSLPPMTDAEVAAKPADGEAPPSTTMEEASGEHVGGTDGLSGHDLPAESGNQLSLVDISMSDQHVGEGENPPEPPSAEDPRP